MSRQAKPLAQAPAERLRRIRLLTLDVDGVLTDGRFAYAPDGGEIKFFHARDGSAIRRLMDAGVPVALVTGRLGAGRRARELGIRYCYERVGDKSEAVDRLAAESGIAAADMAHVGDDIPDVTLFERVGLAFAVADAHAAVIARADYVTEARGGDGAVREICDLILAARARAPARP